VHGENPVHSTSLSISSDDFTSPIRHIYAYKGPRVVGPSATAEEEIAVSEILESEPLRGARAFHQERQDSAPTNPGASLPYSSGKRDFPNDLSVPETHFVARPTYTGLSYTGIPHFITNRLVKGRLISCYFKNISRWFELTDSFQTFTVVHGRLIGQSSCFGPAALAISAKFLENTEDFQGSTILSSQLYEHARSEFQKTLGPQAHPTATSASFCLSAVVLSFYCAMTLQGVETRIELQSYMNALQLHTWEQPLFPTSVACFWAMARLGDNVHLSRIMAYANLFRYMDCISMPPTNTYSRGVVAHILLC
jgi:hypothetical protein